MRDDRPVISPDEAWRRIEPHLRPTGTAFCSRREALGAVLARPAVATCDQPANDVSALDGYAYAGDLAPDSVLPVAGVVAAGDPPGSRLTAGSALQIWTGAPLPLGADRVVGVEETARANREDFVRVLRPAPPGNAVRRRAEIVAAGDLLLSAGARLGPAALSLLASQGVQELEIVRPPRVAVVTTGDEVVAPDLEPGPGQLRDSHTDYLIAAGRRLGVELTALGIAPDDPRLIERWVGRGLEQFDVTLVCGGVSMGERDHTEHALSALGVNVGFDAVAIQPGKPLDRKSVV